MLNYAKKSYQIKKPNPLAKNQLVTVLEVYLISCLVIEACPIEMMVHQHFCLNRYGQQESAT